MMQDLVVCLQELFACLCDREFIARHRTRENAFTRERKLPFRLLVLFLLNQVKGALQREVDDFYKNCVGVTADELARCGVTAAAVCRARRALSPTAFLELHQKLVEDVGRADAGQRWYGWRVMATDGSTLNLPDKADEVWKHFGGQCQSGQRYPMARLSQLWDVGSGLTWHAALEPYEIGEQVCAAEHVDHAPVDALMLYDRGYASFFLFAWHRHRQRHFCMRMKRGFNAAVDAFFAAQSPEQGITLTANVDARALCDEHDVSPDPITLRLVRVVLPTGEVDVLATSLLEAHRFPAQEFGGLYQLRWGVEGDYRFQKTRLQMENFTGYRLHCIRQDVYARLLTKNLVQACLLIAEAAQSRAVPPPTRTSSETQRYRCPSSGQIHPQPRHLAT